MQTIFTQHVLQGKPVLDHILDGPVEKLAKYEILICGSVRCRWKGDRPFHTLLTEKLAVGRTDRRTGSRDAASCFGACNTADGGRFSHLWSGPTKSSIESSSEDDLDEIVRQHLLGGQPVGDLEVPGKTVGRKFLELYGDVAFFNRQSRIALRHSGVIDPESIEEYFHYRGFQALAKVLETGDPQWVIQEITRRISAAAAAAAFPRARSGKWAPTPPTGPATSSATPTKATPAPSWTAACSNAIR